MPRDPIPQKFRQLGADLGNVLDEHRRDLELSVQQLAHVSHVRPNTIHSILAGRNAGPNFFLVANIAQAMDLSLDELHARVRQRTARRTRRH